MRSAEAATPCWPAASWKPSPAPGGGGPRWEPELAPVSSGSTVVRLESQELGRGLQKPMASRKGALVPGPGQPPTETLRGLGGQVASLHPPTGTALGKGGRVQNTSCPAPGLPQPEGQGRRAAVLLSPSRTLWKWAVGHQAQGSWLQHGVPTSKDLPRWAAPSPQTPRAEALVVGDSSNGREPQPRMGGVPFSVLRGRVCAAGPPALAWAPVPSPGASATPPPRPWLPWGAGPRARAGPREGGGWGTRPGATAPTSPPVPQVLLQPLTPGLVDQGRVEPHPRVGLREGELDRSSDEVRRAGAPQPLPGRPRSPPAHGRPTRAGNALHWGRESSEKPLGGQRPTQTPGLTSTAGSLLARAGFRTHQVSGRGASPACSRVRG